MRAHVPPILPHTPEIAIRMPPPPFSFQFMPVRVWLFNTNVYKF